MASKLDDLMTSLPPVGLGGGSVSDRLYDQQKTAYVGSDTEAPLTLNDYIVANGGNKNQIQ